MKKIILYCWFLACVSFASSFDVFFNGGGNPLCGKIIEREAPIHVSNVMLYDTKAKQASRVGYQVVDGKKVRVYKKTGNIVK